MTSVMVAGLLALTQTPQTKVFDIPAVVQAEADEVVHEGGLGNRPGWWSFWSNGTLTVNVRVADEGLYKVAVRACGTTAENPDTREKWPHMRVIVGEATSDWDVQAPWGTPEVYVTDAVRLSPGESTVTVSFTNDYGNAGQDRNLFVDWVAVGPVDSPDGAPILSRVEWLARRAPEATTTDWEFDGTADMQGWQVLTGTRANVGRDGLRVACDSAESGLCSPRLRVAAAKNGCVSVWMRVDKGSRGRVSWASEGRLGLASCAFDLVPDGEFHLYAVDVAQQEEWTGDIVAIAVSPSDEPGAVADVKRIAIADEPVGPPELRVTTFCLDDAMNRAGRDAKLTCRIENLGGSGDPLAAVVLHLPDGVRLVEGAAANLFDLLPTPFTLVWTVRADAPTTGETRVEVNGQGFPATSATTTLEFTPAPVVTPATVDGRPYVPEPQPVHSDYIVGAYYFPGWKQGVHWGWSAIQPFPERKPVLGWYTEGDPSVADWHIKWAAEHGISFFAYDWYWSGGSRSLEHALHDGYLKSRYRSFLKFCLLWANHNAPGSTTAADLEAVTHYWLDNYFHLPEYLKVDNKPVVIIFSVGRISEDLGDGAAAAIARMNELCKAEGFDGLYLVGCVYPSRDTVAAMKAQGYSAATGYNYPDAGSRPEDRNRAPYDLAIPAYQSIWQTIEGYGLLDYIALTDPGWDSRPWGGPDALARTGKSPEKYGQMLELARQFADQHPVGEEKAKIVLTEAWNEFGEGDFIEPHREFGFGYLDAIRSVFTDGPAEHADVIPSDVSLPVPQWDTGTPRTAWDFDKDGDGEGWGPMMGLDDFTVANGAMSATVVSSDPAFACSIASFQGGVDARTYPYARIRMKVDAGAEAQLFWGGPRVRESEAASIRFSLIADGEFHDYVLRLSEVATWRGEISRLRLDPNSDPGSHVAIDYIKLLPLE